MALDNNNIQHLYIIHIGDTPGGGIEMWKRWLPTKVCHKDVAKKEVNTDVLADQESKLQEFTTDLQSESGRKNCSRIARQMGREGRDVIKRHSLQAVELSQWFQAAVQIVSNLPAPSNGGPIYRFLGMPAMRTCCMAGAAAHKSG